LQAGAEFDRSAHAAGRRGPRRHWICHMQTIKFLDILAER